MGNIQRHYVVTRSGENAVQLHPMKQWLRDNPQWLPKDMDTKQNTSHTLRNELVNNRGWRRISELDRMLLLEPGLTEAEVLEAMEALSDDEVETTSVELIEAEEITFGLEKDLQAALRANISQLDSKLTIIDGGKERITEAGRIDITSSDSTGNVVIIELKAGEAMPEAIAQLLSYMGAVSEADRKPVRGILIAGSFHKRAVWAAKAVSNLGLKRYSFQFSFEDVG